MSSSRSRSRGALVIVPGIAMAVLWCVSLVIAFTLFVRASETARSAVDGVVVKQRFAGMVVFEGFHADGRFGVHLGAGLLLLALAPLVIGLLLSIVALFRAGRHA